MASSQPVIVLVTAHALLEDMHPGLLGFFTAKKALPGVLQEGPASPENQPTPRQNVILLEDDLPEPGPRPALHSSRAGLPGKPLAFPLYLFTLQRVELRTIGRIPVDIRF